MVYRSQRDPMSPMIYMPLAEMSRAGFAHDPPWPVSVSVRTESGPPTALVRSVAEALSAVVTVAVVTVPQAAKVAAVSIGIVE